MNEVIFTLGTLREFIKNELTYLYPEMEIASMTDLLYDTILNIPKHEIHLEPQKVISKNKSLKIIEIVNQLKIYKPIQHILGYTHFFGLKLKITPDVLVPRPETEELVKWIIDDNPSCKLSILDIGTGSGCIAITLKTHLPFAHVFASDISNVALKVAQRTAESLKKKITFFRQDILDQAEGKKKKEKGKRKKFSEQRLKLSDIRRPMYDIIVSNPPYIPEKEKKFMNKNVTDWEPHEALFVPDQDHLIFYRNIAEFGLNHLKQEGKIYLEIHEKYAADVKELLEEFRYSQIVIRKDINGKDRMVRCSK